jgi:hypothetical protein
LHSSLSLLSDFYGEVVHKHFNVFALNLFVHLLGILANVFIGYFRIFLGI